MNHLHDAEADRTESTAGPPCGLPGEAVEPEATLRAVAERGCTSLYDVPLMFIAMLGHDALGQLDLSSLRTGCIGAAPCPETTMQGVVERTNMKQITAVYGMTETSPISCQSLSDDPEEVRCSTVGAIQPHLESKIVDSATASGKVQRFRMRETEMAERGMA